MTRTSASRLHSSTPLQMSLQPRLSLIIRTLISSTKTAIRLQLRPTQSRTETRSLYSLPRTFRQSATRFTIKCLPQRLPHMMRATAKRSRMTISSLFLTTMQLLSQSMIRRTAVRLSPRAARATISDSLRICPADTTHGISLQHMLTVSSSLRTALLRI